MLGRLLLNIHRAELAGEVAQTLGSLGLGWSSPLAMANVRAFISQ